MSGQVAKYVVVIEQGPSSYGAHVPDLPGCVAVGDSREEAMRLIQEAVEFHIEGMKLEGEEIPPPSRSVDYVEVAA